MGDETDDDTFDLVIEDIKLEQFIAVVGGVGAMQVQALSLDAMDRAELAGNTMNRLLLENSDLAREALLHADGSEDIRVGNMPDEVLDELDIEVVNGRIRDANAVEIDIE